MNCSVKLVWINFILNIITIGILAYGFTRKVGVDRTQEILDAIEAERRHFGNIESFWNQKWRLIREEIFQMQAKLARIFK